uniref:mRNA (guanine-N(7))-methyltransferase n=1 Tax=Gongylonema pulchrum TaxID=637853 RepID=A0A183DMD4_9BILA
LCDRYFDRLTKFDLCSCQFSLHYCFESEKQARRMIQNAVERLRPGGYFIGTLPDAERITHCIRNSENGVFANGIVQLEYEDAENLKNSDYRLPIFGASYHFSLDTQVWDFLNKFSGYVCHYPDGQGVPADSGGG